MAQRDYAAFARDVRRYRALAVVVLVSVALVPSFVEAITQDLSPLSVLIRVALAFFLIGALVWMVSSVLVRYALAQGAREQMIPEESEAS